MQQFDLLKAIVVNALAVSPGEIKRNRQYRLGTEDVSRIAVYFMVKRKFMNISELAAISGFSENEIKAILEEYSGLENTLLGKAIGQIALATLPYSERYSLPTDRPIIGRNGITEEELRQEITEIISRFEFGHTVDQVRGTRPFMKKLSSLGFELPEDACGLTFLRTKVGHFTIMIFSMDKLILLKDYPRPEALEIKYEDICATDITPYGNYIKLFTDEVIALTNDRDSFISDATWNYAYMLDEVLREILNFSLDYDPERGLMIDELTNTEPWNEDYTFLKEGGKL